MAKRTTANIMLVGRTGAGKSELINYLIGNKVAKVGCGEPITQTFDEYYYTFRDGFRIRVFDSKGLEVDSFADTVNDIELFVSKRSDSDDLSDWLHLVAYCIDSGSKRIEPVEIQFINKIQALTKTKMIIVLTHCADSRQAIISEMESLLKRELQSPIHIYHVNSVYKKLKTGEEMKTFGRKQLLDDLDDTIWDNISNRMVTEYGEKLRAGLTKIVYQIEKELYEQVDKGRWVDLARNRVTSKKLEVSEHRFNTFIKERENQFYDCQQALLKMYYAFKETIGGRYSEPIGVEPEIIADNVISLDSLYAVLSKNNFISETKEKIEELSFWEKPLARLRYKIKVREEMKDHIHEYCGQMIERIPSQDEIETLYRRRLEKTRSTYEKHTPVKYKYEKKDRN